MARSKFERRAHKRLEKEGWEVDYKIRPSRPNPHYNTDYWNLFDLAAYKDGEPLRFISVKGATVPKPHREALEEFSPSGITIEVWSYRKLKTRDRRYFYVKAQRYDGLEWQEIFDDKAITGL